MIKPFGASTSFAWRLFWRSPVTLVPLALAVLINLASWLVTYWQLELGSGWLTIRYSIYVGANWVAPWYFIWLPSLVGGLIIIVNAGLGYVIGLSNINLRYLLVWSAAAASLALGWLQFLLVIFNS